MPFGIKSVLRPFCVAIVGAVALPLAIGAFGGDRAIAKPAVRVKARDAAVYNTTRLANGTYLYGESSRPQEFGREYVVFENRNGRTIGALYLPDSEYVCFTGELQGGRLNAQLIHADGSNNNYTIALGRRQSAVPVSGSLTANYQPLAQLGNLDRQLLNICRQQTRSRA
jgi:hypothetical protein